MTIDLTENELDDLLKAIGGPYDDRKDGLTGQGRVALIQKLVAAKRVRPWNPSVEGDG